MPLDWLGQLKPTMEQQIALQRALLALVREDEAARAKTTEKEPALARGLGVGGSSLALAGKPSYAETHQPQEVKEPTDWEAVWDRKRMLQKEALARQLEAAKPSPGYEDPQAKAWARREEILEERVIGAKDAYDHIVTLDPEGQKIALDAVRKYKRGVYDAMEREGYISPTGVLAEPKKGVINVSTWTDEDGWLNQTTVYEDGTTETEIIGRGEKEPVEAPSVSDIVALEKLGIEVKKFGERHLERAIKTMGDMPRAKIDTVTEDGAERLATVEDEQRWRKGIETLATYYRSMAGEAPEGEVPLTLDEVKTMYEGRPELISDIQQQLGLTVTGVWDDTLSEAFKTYGGVE